MIQQLVVGTDGSPDARTAVRQALFLAGETGASVKCVFIVDLRKTQMPYIYAGGSYEGAFERLYVPPDPSIRRLYEQLATDLDEFAEKQMEECRQLAVEAGVGLESVIKSGYPGIELCDESRSGGMLVVGRRGENAHYKRSIVGSITDDLIHKSPRPMLICPTIRIPVRRIVFVYDGSRASERALQFYVHGFGELSARLLFCPVCESRGGDHRIEEELSFLDRHGVSYELAEENEDSASDVLKVAQRNDADMIILGAQSRHRFRDYVLGSTVSHVVHRSTVPILLVF